MTKDLRESPKTIQRKHQKQDFGLYIQEVMRTANRRGASLPCYMEESLENCMSSAEYCLNVTQMKEDFNAVRCGDKKPEDVSSSNHCKGILVDSELAKYNTDTNSEALSEAISELLKEEVRFVLLTKNCCSFIFWRRRYTVLPPQGKVIRLLIDAAAKGDPDVPERKIRKILEKENDLQSSSELRYSFRSPPLWNTLLVSKRAGTRYLVFFPENPKLHDSPD